MANTKWGYQRQQLRQTYIATGRSIIEYASAVWHPWLSKTNIEKLQSAQRFACRVITGKLKTPNGLLLLESNLPPISARSCQNATFAYEKALRLPDDNSRANVTKKSGQQRTKKCGWRNKTKEMWNQILDQDLTEPFPNLPPPWKEVNNVHFIGTMVTKKQNKDEQRTQAEKVIKERN